ncbi:phosphate:acyl-[acyl carrier protein] acyltransferase [Fodinibius roseus]|uniref:Phosphate acyltransferase n=1 Tax=Fodinibius roseus TaxID=1194090 RepID=A0A1M5F797_9BACT|nr:phosphate acyltransferase PlsX [Fodinibius roseus]SHF87480.1 phosphate:acyl-[acyl carrier protein] acyltransferase [Fodinibius roseus]
MVIAVDAAGGDHYPESPVQGAIEAINETSELTIMLVGPEDVVSDELANHDYDRQRIKVQHAPEIIEMDESPAQAVKTKQKSSIVTGIGMHRAGECHAFVSSGNTGALLAASTFLLGKLKGVSRPAIAAIFPTIKGVRLVMDVGANLEVRPDMYPQFARMGAIYVREIMGVDNPKVGLLNVGEEEEKGTDNLKEAFQKLEGLPNFVGNVEGRDIFNARADVFLCDALVGNILLKFGESIPAALGIFIKRGIQELEMGSEEAQLVNKVLETSLREFNPDRVGGVPFLGVDGVSMVGHGSSTPRAIKNMILNAAKCIEYNINEKIVASLN